MRITQCVALGLLLVAGCESEPDVEWDPGGGGTPGPSAVPGPPAGLTATPAVAAVTLEWLPNGDSEAVTEYVVYVASTSWAGAWSSGLPDASRTAGLPCCEHTVTGLENDTPYWFAVAAVNSLGEGISSPPLKQTPPGWPGTIWVGTGGNETAADLAIDGEGNLLVAGTTDGSFPGFVNGGMGDAFVVKFLPDGTLAWVSQLTLGGNQESKAIAVNEAGDVFVTGNHLGSGSYFAWSLSGSGSTRYSREHGISFSTSAQSIAVVGTSAAIAGSTGGNLFGSSAGGTDAFYAVLNGDGTVAWGRQFGTSQADYARGIAPATGGGFYLVGETYGAFAGETNAGSADVFVARYDTSGTQDWLYQGGSSTIDLLIDAAEFGGALYVTGETYGGFYGVAKGMNDVLILSLELDGDVRWGISRGSAEEDQGARIAVHGTGAILVGGRTEDLTGTTALLMQFDQSDPYMQPTNHQWTTTSTFGYSMSSGFAGLATRGGDAFVVGSSIPAFPAVTNDVYVARYGPDGVLK